MFRVVSLMEPDMKQIITAKCTQYGIKCGDILGNRLKVLFEVCRDSMMSHESKAQITVSNLVDILYVFYTQKKPSQVQSSYGQRSNTFLNENQNDASRKYASSKIEGNFSSVLLVLDRQLKIQKSFTQHLLRKQYQSKSLQKRTESH